MIYSRIYEISNNYILESRDVTFFEHIFPMKNKLSKYVGDSNFDTSAESSSNLNLENQENFQLRRSKRGRIEEDFGADFFTHLVEYDPKTYEEAMNSIDASFWR